MLVQAIAGNSVDCMLVQAHMSLAGEVVGQLCSHYGPRVYGELQELLISGIKMNMERDATLPSEEVEPVNQDGRVTRTCSSLAWVGER